MHAGKDGAVSLIERTHERLFVRYGLRDNAVADYQRNADVGVSDVLPQSSASYRPAMNCVNAHTSAPVKAFCKMDWRRRACRAEVVPRELDAMETYERPVNALCRMLWSDIFVRSIRDNTVADYQRDPVGFLDVAMRSAVPPVLNCVNAHPVLMQVLP